MFLDYHYQCHLIALHEQIHPQHFEDGRINIYLDIRNVTWTSRSFYLT